MSKPPPKMLKHLPLILLTASALSCTPPDHQFEALNEIEASIGVGVTMIKYRQLVTDFQTEFNTVKNPSEEATAKLQGHKLALDWWSCKVADKEGIEDQWQAADRCRDELLPEVEVVFPELYSDIKSLSDQGYDADAVLKVMWRELSEDGSVEI